MAALNLFLTLPLSGATGLTAVLLATTPKFITSFSGCFVLYVGESGGKGDGGGVGRVWEGAARRNRWVSRYLIIGFDGVEGR
jgi:hypothetical protein